MTDTISPDVLSPKSTSEIFCELVISNSGVLIGKDWNTYINVYTPELSKIVMYAFKKQNKKFIDNLKQYITAENTNKVFKAIGFGCGLNGEKEVIDSGFEYVSTIREECSDFVNGLLKGVINNKDIATLKYCLYNQNIMHYGSAPYLGKLFSRANEEQQKIILKFVKYEPSCSFDEQLYLSIIKDISIDLSLYIEDMRDFIEACDSVEDFALYNDITNEVRIGQIKQLL